MPTTKLPPEALSELLDQRAQELGAAAYRRALATGAPVAICEDGIVYHVFADGSRVAVKKVGNGVKLKKGDEFGLK